MVILLLCSHVTFLRLEFNPSLCTSYYYYNNSSNTHVILCSVLFSSASLSSVQLSVTQHWVMLSGVIAELVSCQMVGEGGILTLISTDQNMWGTDKTLQLECMSLPFSPYLTQILTTLLKSLITLQGIKISIYVCNSCEVILFLSGTINFTTTDRLQLVWTSFFSCCGLIRTGFMGQVAVPEWISPDQLQLPVFEKKKKKTSLNWTQKH